MNRNIQKQKIYDTHIHLWDLSLKKHTWLTNNTEETFLGEYSAIQKNYLFEDYQNDSKDFEIVGCTHIQAGWNRREPENESKWVEYILHNQNIAHSIIGYADLTAQNLESTLDAHKQYSSVVGIRQVLNWNSDPYYSMCSRNIIEDIRFLKGFQTLKKYRLHFELQAYSNQLEFLLPLFKSEPNIPVVIEHCGLPLFFCFEDVLKWKKTLQQAAQMQHIFVKISGLGMFSNLKNRLLTDEQIVLYCIETFGVHRCVFGSNLPVDKLYRTYKDTLTAILNCRLNQSDLDLILWKNAFEIYN